MVLAPCSVHTGWKSEAQLTKKQAVLLMRKTLPQGAKSIRALLEKQNINNLSLNNHTWCNNLGATNRPFYY